MEITPRIADELLAWIKVAKDQLRDDLISKNAHVEIDKVNRAACKRAEVLYCKRTMEELDANGG